MPERLNVLAFNGSISLKLSNDCFSNGFFQIRLIGFPQHLQQRVNNQPMDDLSLILLNVLHDVDKDFRVSKQNRWNII